MTRLLMQNVTAALRLDAKYSTMFSVPDELQDVKLTWQDKRSQEFISEKTLQSRS